MSLFLFSLFSQIELGFLLEFDLKKLSGNKKKLAGGASFLVYDLVWFLFIEQGSRM